MLGEGKPVWIADPRDAQYLNTTEAELLRMAAHEAGEGLMVVDGEYAAATPTLMARAAEYQAALEAALNFTKPQFNESMRVRPREYVGTVISGQRPLSGSHEAETATSRLPAGFG